MFTRGAWPTCAVITAFRLVKIGKVKSVSMTTIIIIIITFTALWRSKA